MRNTLISVLALIALLTLNSPEARPQGTDFSNARIFSAGFSLNYSYGYIGSRSIRIPPVNASLEIGIHEFVTVGPFVAYSSWSYPARTRSFVNAGVRGSFHFSPLLNDLLDGSIDENQIDFYASMLSGLEFRQYGASSDEGISGFIDNTRLFLGPVAGVRFYFADNFGVFSEVGRGALGAITVGVSLNL